jgi:ribosomal protein S18 acetylase RimI-like enzyme
MTTVRALPRDEVEARLDDLARLRIAVFREWPYLYDGDLDYEREYLRTYVESAASVLVVAEDGARVVGASTGVPLADESPDFRAPYAAAGIDPARVFYFGESVLLPEYRGRGIGHRFFDAREAHAAALGGFAWTSFCAVVRADDDPRRPPGYRALDAFWTARGYVRRPDIVTTIAWKELGEAVATEKRLVAWLRTIGS